MATIGQKVGYVKSAPNAGGHHCHWPGCDKSVSPAKWGCTEHWYRLPQALRNRVWATFRPGQEISKTPSAGYVAVAREVQDWIQRNYAP